MCCDEATAVVHEVIVLRDAEVVVTEVVWQVVGRDVTTRWLEAITMG